MGLIERLRAMIAAPAGKPTPVSSPAPAPVPANDPDFNAAVEEWRRRAK